MHEPVGHCSFCQKEINCLNGFLNGVVTADGELLCFDCAEKEKDKGSTSLS